MKISKKISRFCRWKNTDNNDMNIFLSLENPCTFLLAKEKSWKSSFNTNSELSQNRTEKQIMPLKTTVNLLFNDIWRYLLMVVFSEKLAFSRKQLQGFIVSLKQILENYWFCQISGNIACGKGLGSSCLRHYNTIRTKIDMSLTLNWIDLMVFSVFLVKKIVTLH